MRPDFIIHAHGKKIAIDVKAWRTPPPLHFVARVRDYARTLLSNKAADEVLIVTKARLPIAENLLAEEGIRFITVKELASYLRQKK